MPLEPVERSESTTRDRDVEREPEPGREQLGRRGVDGAGHLDGLDLLVRRLVERRGEHGAPERQPRPREVGVAGPVRLGEVVERALRVRLRGGVGDAALRDAPERRLGDDLGHVRPRPPRDDRGVGQQQPGDEPLLVGAGGPRDAEHDDLARAGVAADADLRVDPGRRLDAARLVHDDDHAHRVLAGGVVRGLDGLLRGAALGADHEGEHAAEGDRAALLAQGDERAAHLRDGGVGQVDDHGRLQTRPSRAMQRIGGRRAPRCPGGTAPAGRRTPRSARPGRGSSRTARPPRGGGRAAGRRAARRGSAARTPPGSPR